jgi:hypothetical protein
MVDNNECLMNPNLCSDGTCLNTDGGFICQCPENYVLSPDGKKCVDIRQDLCYDGFLGGNVSTLCLLNNKKVIKGFNIGSYNRGVCTKSRRGYVSRMTRCCTEGRAWGASCDSCPNPGTSNIETMKK